MPQWLERSVYVIPIPFALVIVFIKRSSEASLLIDTSLLAWRSKGRSMPTPVIIGLYRVSWFQQLENTNVLSSGYGEAGLYPEPLANWNFDCAKA